MTTDQLERDLKTLAEPRAGDERLRLAIRATLGEQLQERPKRRQRTRLVRFEAPLADAIERDLRPRRSHRISKRVVRLSLTAAVAAGVALGALSLVTGNGPSAVARAAAALQLTDGTILHMDMTVDQPGSGGTSSSFREETWQEASAPFAFRSVRTQNGVRIDVVSRADGSSEFYDATTNTVYSITGQDRRFLEQPRPVSPPPPRATLRPAPATAPLPIGPPSLNPAPEPGTQNQAEAPFRQRVLGILQSGEVSEAGHVSVDGRDALKLASADGTVTILVDPQTYDPILWTMAGGPTGPGLTAHFSLYERIPDTQQSATLFDLRAQHPDARLDTNPADYATALARLSG
jgi:hypothetical protein